MLRASVRAVRKAVKTKLRSFLDAKEPGLVMLLQSLWHDQIKAITYKEIREAILSGEFAASGIISGGYAEKWLDDWRQDYSRFVQAHLLPLWLEAIEAGAREIQDKHPGWHFNPAEPRVREWARTHGAAFVTNSTRTQIEGLRAVLRRASASDVHGMSVDRLARVVRPFVGLTIQQTAANMKYHNTLIEGGMSEKKALDLSIKYGQRQHRYRGYNIARTELAFAYNRGAFEGVKQAQRLGLMGRVVKRWVVAEDERTCQECAALDGALIDLDAEFNFYTRLTEPGIKLMPPAHPSCRCTVAFDEVEPPRMDMPGGGDGTPPGISGLYDENGNRFDFISEVEPHNILQPTGRYDIIEEIPGSVKTPEAYTWESIINAPEDEIRKFIQSDAQPKVILVGKQGKHIKGHNNYTEGRSYITIPIEKIQELVKKYAGTGQLEYDRLGKWAHKEIIQLDKVIGFDVSQGSEKETPATDFKIHYSKKGTHIVPRLKGAGK